jgi:hypothetical protein
LISQLKAWFATIVLFGNCTLTSMHACSLSAERHATAAATHFSVHAFVTSWLILLLQPVLLHECRLQQQHTLCFEQQQQQQPAILSTCKQLRATPAAAAAMVLPLQVEAEEVDDVTEKFGVTTVPYFVLLQVGLLLVELLAFRQCSTSCLSSCSSPASLCFT